MATQRLMSMSKAPKRAADGTAEERVLTTPPPLAEIRAELEAMVIGDLLGPAGGESEELTERTVRDRYMVRFHENFQDIRFFIGKPAYCVVFPRLFKLNQKRHAEEFTQGLHDKKYAKATQEASGLFDMGGEK